jgi:5-methyltetrahydropteroyltriglutamate--homocysteine methyltransferase
MKRCIVEFLTTVIGSFPVKKLPLEDAIHWAVDLQLKHGVDLITDGEQRSDMIGYFGFFSGLGMGPKGPYIESRVLPSEDPRSYVKISDWQFMSDYLGAKGRKDVRTKITVTGPVTLAFSCAMNGLKYYSSVADARLYSDFADALKPLIREIAGTGCYVQVDEPSLSARVMDSREAVKVVNQSLAGLPSELYDLEKLSIHVCGELNRKLFNDLMKLDVPVLSLAFSSPNVDRNLRVVSRRVLIAEQKKLGVGCVSVQATRGEQVEKPDVVLNRLETIVQRIGKDRVAFLHPDCGLRSTGEEAVEPILERLMLSAKFLREAE